MKAEEVRLRERLKSAATAVSQQAELDRATYVSVKELLSMLGPNVKSAQSLYGMMAGLGMETISTNQGGNKNTWLTEDQAKVIIGEVLSHPVRTHLGGTVE